MIKPNELRIGNWINSLGEWQIRDGEDIDDSKYFEPIPLTEQWLIDFGFEKVDKWDGYGGFLKKINDRSLLRIAFLNGYWGYEGNVVRSITQYVHQLQNLYFALTGTELERIVK